jgi:hypothetical protein
VNWHRFGDKPPSPLFELRPRNAASMTFAVADGGAWVDAVLDVDGQELWFELWAPTFEKQLRTVVACVSAVVAGAVSLELRSTRARWLRSVVGWRVVATFEIGEPALVLSRTPANLREYRGLFPSQLGDEARGRLGPRRFAPFLPVEGG